MISLFKGILKPHNLAIATVAESKILVIFQLFQTKRANGPRWFIHGIVEILYLVRFFEFRFGFAQESSGGFVLVLRGTVQGCFTLKFKLTTKNDEDVFGGFALIEDELIDFEFFNFKIVNEFLYLVLSLELQERLLREKVYFVLDMPSFSFS